MKTTIHHIVTSSSNPIRKVVSGGSLKNSGIAILSILFGVGSLALAGETNNLVANGGFEKPADGDNIADGWQVKFALCSGEQKHEGKASLKLPVLADDEKKQIEAQQGMDVSLFKAGDEVEFSLYAMSTAKLGPGSNPYARILITDANWYQQAELRVDLPREPSGKWKKLSGKFTIPAGFTTDCHVKIQVVTWIEAKPETAGAIYVDDVHVTKHPPAKP